MLEDGRADAAENSREPWYAGIGVVMLHTCYMVHTIQIIKR